MKTVLGYNLVHSLRTTIEGASKLLHTETVEILNKHERWSVTVDSVQETSGC